MPRQPGRTSYAKGWSYGDNLIAAATWSVGQAFFRWNTNLGCCSQSNDGIPCSAALLPSILHFLETLGSSASCCCGSMAGREVTKFPHQQSFLIHSTIISDQTLSIYTHWTIFWMRDKIFLFQHSCQNSECIKTQTAFDLKPNKKPTVPPVSLTSSFIGYRPLQVSLQLQIPQRCRTQFDAFAATRCTHEIHHNNLKPKPRKECQHITTS